eukprot:SAG11_NODE_20012_length_454_cov_1.402817_1_plen_97_part_10
MLTKVEANEHAEELLSFSRTAGKFNTNNNMCERCGSKQARYGLVGEKRKRWCAGCGKGVEGVVSLANPPVARRMCEECGSNQANYGLVGEKRQRWCA